MSEKKRSHIKEAYGQFAHSVSPLEKSNIQWKMIYRVLKKLPKDAKILDIACGDGKYLLELKKMGFTNIYGVDLFDSISCQGINYQRADFNCLPFKEDYFDFCYCVSAIYYSDKVGNTLAEWQRVLKSNGHLFFSGHTKYSIHTGVRMIKKVFLPKRFPHLVHAHFYSPDKLQIIAENLGFKTLARDGFFTSWIDKIVKNSATSTWLNKVAPVSIKFSNSYHFTLLLKNI